MNQPTPILVVSAVDKTFTMHLQGGQHLAVLERLGFEVFPGECVVLGGPSGAGKSTILKLVYGNYAVDRGQIVLGAGTVDIATADPRSVLAARRHTMATSASSCVAYLGFPALQVVAEPLVERGVAPDEARSAPRAC